MKRVIAASVLALLILGSASVASASAGSIGETTTTTTTTTPVLVEAAPVPIKSGTGRRIVYANRQQRVEMQVEARCWCGQRANNNARLVNGKIVYEGETVVVGDTDKTTSEPLFGDDVRYELLCRKHYIAGDMGPAI